MNKAAKQYVIRFSAAMAAYTVTLPLAIAFARSNSQSVWRFAVMLIPVIPVTIALLVFVQYFEKMDELQKRIQLYAFALSAGGTGIIGLTYGLLESVGAPHISWIWVFPIIIMLWGLGAAIASRRYQ